LSDKFVKEIRTSYNSAAIQIYHDLIKSNEYVQTDLFLEEFRFDLVAVDKIFNIKVLQLKISGYIKK